MTRFVKLLPVGTLDYGKCLRLQNFLSEEIKRKRKRDTVIVAEHNPVYTVGIRDGTYSKDDEAKLLNLGAGFYRVNRGGLITFHGPGQLVAYPILDLRNYKTTVRGYVKLLEDTVIDTCGRFSINAQTSVHTGVWIGDMKVCSLGIRVSRHVTTHGLALNCNVDLNWFSHIVPCGIVGKKVTSLSEELQAKITVDEVLPKFKESFGKLFSSEMIDMDGEETAEILQRFEHHGDDGGQ